MGLRKSIKVNLRPVMLLFGVSLSALSASSYQSPYV